MNVLLTGASGFVGSALLARLLADGKHRARGAYRRLPDWLAPGAQTCVVADLGPDVDWQMALSDIDIVVHCSARVHVMAEQAVDPLMEFRRANVEGTLRLANQAVEAGVKRFVFLSSIKVNGEGTDFGKRYTADDSPAPSDPYGVSKLEAEQGLLALGAKTGMEVVIIRPVLVYGPGAKANFRNMMSWLSKGVPLPFGLIHNQRSLVALGTLVDLIVTCLEHPAAANQIFLVSDGEDLSTTQLLRRMGQALGKSPLLLPVPQGWLSGAANMLGKGAVAQRLCGSLQVDMQKTCQVLGWTPPLTVDEALGEAARHFLAHRA
ncbi:UDP-glucose 4-epimerase family protein [Pseudomonas gingeri]|uniref:UDP-glucose 4-epimerase family protein n=1 Tax=Pseudomonas gingeri TaxID=117681 RepID=UPI0015A16B9C|nr:SDR family oxidoreductase [Pseudomonas gingeri]NWE45770.1 SDR family oxidoreductase [Pseudomonas gingeri]